MIVLALFGIIGVSLFSSFTMGLKIWKRATSANVAERKAVIGLERLSTEIRRAAGYPSIGLFGEAAHLDFANIIGDKIYGISYAYAAADKCLYRTATARQPPASETEPVVSRKIMVGVKDMAFSFFRYNNTSGGVNFVDTWNYTASGMPSAVKVFLVLEDGKEFEKVIEVPIAQ